jgi:type VI secretion system secreted protein VgrG
VRPGERLAAELSREDAEAGTTTELLVLRVEHEIEVGADGVVFRNRAEAVTTTTPFAPARVTPRPTITAPQTGIVTSFSKEKQLVVNVKMDWGAKEPVVLPVRMTQPLAGSDHGAILLPHKGNEVLVHFIDGVPERPVLIGALYHKTAQSAVSGGIASGDSSFLSRLTMLGARGPTNVIEVDDATNNSEIIRMSAINDVEVKVGRNEKHDVVGTYDDHVKGDVTVTLDAKRTTKVTGDETYETDGKVAITVHKTGRVLVNETLQMTADTKLSLVSGNTRADFSPSAAKITVGGSVLEMTASGVKITCGGASVELTSGSIKITAPMVNINNGSLQVM